MRIEEPSLTHFTEISHLIGRFELDDRNLQQSEFLGFVMDDQLLGFGRVREYPTCSELCSLGVIEPRRNKGIGRQLVQELTRKAIQPLYLVCIIPGFFEPLGFSITTDYPVEIENKLQYCRSALTVPEEYVVMKYEKPTL
jgi:N-acetylglutamate synthase-like GNAT family acetyltransferase